MIEAAALEAALELPKLCKIQPGRLLTLPLENYAAHTCTQK